MLTAQTFSQVTMDVASSSTDYARSYEIYVSNDAVSWVGPVASGTGGAGVTTIAFPTQTGRFVGIVQTGAASSNWWSIAELNVYSAGAVPIVPLTGTGWVATASVSSSSNQPSKALDGDLGTRFATGTAQANGQWFQVDMLTPQLITKLTMDSDGNTSDYARGYQVFASNDTSNWGAAIASGTGTSSLITVSFAQTTKRYLKVALTSSASNWWSIAELTVYTVGSFGPTASVLPRLGWSASASASSGSNTPDKTLDDSGSSRWTTGVNQANGQYIRVDMQAPRSFTKLTLDAGSSNSGDYPRGYQVFVSNDGSTWGPAVATGTGSSQVVLITFAYQSARYIKIVQTGSSSTTGVCAGGRNVRLIDG